MRKVLLAVDPGVVTMGAAVWDHGEFTEAINSGDPIKPLDTMSVTLKSVSNPKPVDRVKCITQLTDALMSWLVESELRPLTIVCEYPQVFATSSTGLAAANDAMGIMFFVGCLRGIFYTDGVEFIPASVTAWKGNMSKELTQRRVQKRYPDANDWLGKSSHAWDAVGIGLWAMGEF